MGVLCEPFWAITNALYVAYAVEYRKAIIGLDNASLGTLLGTLVTIQLAAQFISSFFEASSPISWAAEKPAIILIFCPVRCPCCFWPARRISGGLRYPWRFLAVGRSIPMPGTAF